MSARKRHKGNKYDEPFVGFVTSVLDSPLLIKLSPHAVKLLVDVAAQYRGNNNGDLSIAWKLMKPRGWRSEATLHKVKRELVEAGFLYETRKGRRPNVCSLFALTWFYLDDNPKFDSDAKAGFVRKAYHLNTPLKIVPGGRGKREATSSAVAAKAA